MATDVHQHIWTPGFAEALRRRDTPPFLDGWTLHLHGEQPFATDPRDHDAERRRALDADLDLALVSLSSPLGIEHLPPDEAWPLIDAYHDGALALPAPFGAWAGACVSEIDPARTAAALDRGFAGLQLPATAVGDAAGLERAAPLLDLLEERDLPLFVHPGPASAPGAPAWWAAVVPYVQQMHAAWYAFHAFGRPRHPRLRVCFALLAGLAPLHTERLIARGGSTRGVVDPDVFLETSSYGHQAIDAITRVTGIEVVVLGSDRPYASPAKTLLGAAAEQQMRCTNPARLLGAAGTPATTSVVN